MAKNKAKHKKELSKAYPLKKTHNGKVGKLKKESKMKALIKENLCNGPKRSNVLVDEKLSTLPTKSPVDHVISKGNKKRSTFSKTNTAPAIISTPEILPQKEFNSPGDQQLQNLRTNPTTTTLATKTDTSIVGHGEKRKRKRALKKTQDGVSNWASLCSVLKIDPKRKKKVPQSTEKNKDEDSLPTEAKTSKPEVWFDNVDKILLENGTSADAQMPSDDKEDADKNLVKPDSYKGVTHCVAMDCEMVGVGPRGEESILARVSLVNHYGVCLYDKFVLPREKVTDYRTHVSGVTRENLSTGKEFTKVQREVNDIISGKILVGHALHNDLKVLFLTHPHKMIRDTSKYKPFRQIFKGGIPSLKKLADRILGVSVQEGQHSSVQDAQAAMRLYTMHRQRWEKELKLLRKQDKMKNKKAKKKKEKQPSS